MKVLLLSTNDVGGAGRVTRNIYEILRNKIYIKYWVKNKLKDNGSLQISNFKFFDLVKQKFNRKISSFGKSNIYSYKSPSIFPTKLNKKINNTNFDIVHLTWINDDFLSIEDIGKINKPIVWSLCDMWPFSGVNHYEDFSEKAFWRNKNFLKSKVDFINKISVYRKKKNWKNSMNIITPNKWLSDCVKDSFVMNECKIKTINWPVIKEKFFPITNKIY